MHACRLVVHGPPPHPHGLPSSLSRARCTHPQDRVAEQRAKRKRLLTAVQSARIRKGMIRYTLLVRN